MRVFVRNTITKLEVVLESVGAESRMLHVDPRIVKSIHPAQRFLATLGNVLPRCSVLFLSASRNSTRIMARRRSLSTALPAPFALLPCWPFFLR